MNLISRLLAALAGLGAAAGFLIIGGTYNWWPAYPLATVCALAGWLYASSASRRK